MLPDLLLETMNSRFPFGWVQVKRENTAQIERLQTSMASERPWNHQ
jgi:hypothetical protein